MVAWGDDDIAQAFDDLLAAGATVAVVWQGVTVQGVVDEEDVVRSTPEGVEIAIRESVVRVPAGTLPDLQDGDELLIDGVVCQARDPGVEGDGAMQRIPFVRAT